jgi:hypothetical protein
MSVKLPLDTKAYVWVESYLSNYIGVRMFSEKITLTPAQLQKALEDAFKAGDRLHDR